MRAQAYSALSRFATQGFSFRAAARMARSLGYRFRSQWGLNVFRQARLYRQFRSPTLAIPKSHVIPRNLVSDVDLRRARLYRVFGNVIYHDPETGEEDEQFISFYTDELSSSEAMIFDWDRRRRRADYRVHLEIKDFAITHVQHNRGLPW
ncbi:MAG: hypothetical protein ACE5K8_09030 [Candidatus Zixiibacteriota bacterium]